MKKIAVVSLSNNFDMQESIYNLYADMKSEDLDVITVGSNKLRVSINIDENNKLFNVPNRPGIEVKTLNFIELFKILKVLNKVDIVYFFSSHIWNIILIKLLKKNIKVIHTIHDVFPHENENQTNSVLRYNKYICNTVKFIVIHNEKYIKKFIEYYKYKGKVIYSPLWRSWNNYYEKNVTYNRVLFIGRVNPYKGVQSIKTFAQAIPNARFDIMGKFCDEMIEIKNEFSQISNIKIEDRYLSEYEMINEIRNSDIVILPYISATQSGVVLDAYRNSTPVIAFNVGALSEQVSSKEFLIDEGDIDAFIAKLGEFMEKSMVERNKISKECWELGKQKFSSYWLIRELKKL